MFQRSLGSSNVNNSCRGPRTTAASWRAAQGFGSRSSPLHHHRRRPTALPTAEQPSPVTEPAPAEALHSSADSQVQTLQQQKIDWGATLTCFTFPAIAGALFGFDIGATSGVVASLTSEVYSGTTWGPQLTSLQTGLVVGMSLAGALGGSLLALLLGNSAGRKSELLAAAAFYGLGSLVTGGAPSLEVLLAGRALYGLGIGLAMHAAPAYIAETSPPGARGLLVSCKEAAIVGGILLGLVVGYLFSEEQGGWRSAYDLGVGAAALLAGGMALLPESPRWLLLAGKGREEAAQAIVRAEGQYAAQDPQYLSTQVDRILSSLAASTSTPTNPSQAKSSHAAADHSVGEGSSATPSTSSSTPVTTLDLTELLTEPRFARPLAVGASLMLFQQLTGQPSVLYRAATILEGAGFSPGRGAASVAVLLGVFKLVMTLVAVAKVDSWGRRPLLLTGCAGMTVALVMLGAIQLPQTAPLLSTWLGHIPSIGLATVNPAAWISVAALLLYVGCYQFSFGPISWLLVGEMFPLRARSQAIAVATLVNFGSNCLVSVALPPLQEAVGSSSLFFIFASVGLFATLCMYLTVPETAGRSLEDIEAMWARQAVEGKE